MPPMKNGSQLSPAVLDAISGTESELALFPTSAPCFGGDVTLGDPLPFSAEDDPSPFPADPFELWSPRTPPPSVDPPLASAEVEAWDCVPDSGATGIVT